MYFLFNDISEMYSGIWCDVRIEFEFLKELASSHNSIVESLVYISLSLELSL
jgi:hypothetical protein